MWLAEAMNQVQRTATVGASRERRCQSVSGFVEWLIALRSGLIEVAVATLFLLISLSVILCNG